MYQVERDGEVLVKGDEYKVREYIEELLENELGFFVSLQENIDEEDLMMYIHTDNYDELTDEQLERLEQLDITEADSIRQIEQFLGVRIK